MKASSAEWQRSHKLGRWRGGSSNKWRICRGVRKGGHGRGFKEQRWSEGRRRKDEE